MSIIVSNIRLTPFQTDEDALSEAIRITGIKEYSKIAIYKKTVDARRKNVMLVYSVAFDTQNEEEIVKYLNSPNVAFHKEIKYTLSPQGKKITNRPIICGFGPAGIFCALILARYGYRPIVIERGGDIKSRDCAVENFYRNGVLSTENNIQFGEGGAGTYSDGKLTTRIGDPRCSFVLRTFMEHGAPSEILYLAKPHIGTDLLKNVVVSIRHEIESLGGKVIFNEKLTDITVKDNSITDIKLSNLNSLPAEVLVLAIGHSARDTYEMLYNKGIAMEQKPFSVGARIEHLQEELDRAMYGAFADKGILPPSTYQLSYREGDRACYSFCMCPGGEVVAAASEDGRLVVNGMSRHKRNGINANSAVVVSVSCKDFASPHPLAGMEFQRKIEQAAYKAGGGGYYAPLQTVGGFIHGVLGDKPSQISPTYPIGYNLVKLDSCLPNTICDMMRKGLYQFGKKIKGFDVNYALLTGGETRTSAPLRIIRTEDMNSISVKGLIPCGEGAGYAGGIMSAAVDGMKAAERIISSYLPM